MWAWLPQPVYWVAVLLNMYPWEKMHNLATKSKVIFIKLYILYTLPHLMAESPINLTCCILGLWLETRVPGGDIYTTAGRTWKLLYIISVGTLYLKSIHLPIQTIEFRCSNNFHGYGCIKSSICEWIGHSQQLGEFLCCTMTGCHLWIKSCCEVFSRSHKIIEWGQRMLRLIVCRGH